MDKKEKNCAYLNKTIQLEQAYNKYLKTKKKKHLVNWYSIVNKPIEINK